MFLNAKLHKEFRNGFKTIAKFDEFFFSVFVDSEFVKTCDELVNRITQPKGTMS